MEEMLHERAWVEADLPLYNLPKGRALYTRRLQIVVNHGRVQKNFYWARGQDPLVKVEIEPIEAEDRLAECLQILIVFFGASSHIGKLVEVLQQKPNCLLTLVEKLTAAVESFFEVASGIRKVMMQIVAETEPLSV